MLCLSPFYPQNGHQSVWGWDVKLPGSAHPTGMFSCLKNIRSVSKQNRYRERELFRLQHLYVRMKDDSTNIKLQEGRALEM